MLSRSGSFIEVIVQPGWNVLCLMLVVDLVDWGGCNKGLQVPANAGENLCHQIQHNDLLIMPFHLFSIFYCNQMNGNKKRDVKQTYRSSGYSTMRFHKMY